MNHIKHIHEEEKSWCGQILESTETHFKTLDQAVLNGLHFSQTVACGECIKRVIDALHLSAGRFVVNEAYQCQPIDDLVNKD